MAAIMGGAKEPLDLHPGRMRDLRRLALLEVI